MICRVVAPAAGEVRRALAVDADAALADDHSSAADATPAKMVLANRRRDERVLRTIGIPPLPDALCIGWSERAPSANGALGGGLPIDIGPRMGPNRHVIAIDQI